MRITVRRATIEDISWLLTQLTHFSRFFGSKRELCGNLPYAEGFLHQLVEKHLLLIADGEGVGQVGFVAGLVTPHPFNPDISLLAETFWWVSEEHRGSRAGLMLLDAFTDWGKKNVNWLTFGLEEISPVSDRCLTKRGFKLRERSYLLEVS